MKNLAGEPSGKATRIATEELEASRFQVQAYEPHPHAEVQAVVKGVLVVGNRTYEATRRWYYWAVEGPVPLAMAERLYADPARDDIRAGGYAGGIEPKTQTKWYTAPNGKELIPEAQRAELEALMERGLITQAQRDGWQFAEDPTKIGIGYVHNYHIDSVMGLRVFADYLTEATYKP